MPAPASRHRRTQRERSDATRGRLVDAARELFASRGYPDTALDDITSAADVTKGALYHHFDGKRDVFHAVCEREQRGLTELQSAAFRAQGDPWDGFRAGCEAYLQAATDPGVQRILHVDAPAVLGWDGIRELEQPTYEMAAAGLRLAMRAGRIAERDPEPLLDLLFGALGAAAMTIARADDSDAALRATAGELGRLLDALTIP